MSTELVAQGILTREREAKEYITYGVADPAIFVRDGGPSKAEIMLKEGVMFKRADNKRDPGWAQMRMLLGNIPLDPSNPEGPKTDPMLFVCETCEDSIRTIPTLQHDEDKLEDLDTEGEDHAADEWRYAVMSRPWIKYAKAPPASNLPKLPSETTINELVERLRQKRIQRTNRD